jgi:hypothetical protein
MAIHEGNSRKWPNKCNKYGNNVNGVIEMEDSYGMWKSGTKNYLRKRVLLVPSPVK